MASDNFEFEVPNSSASIKKPGKRWYRKWWGISILVFLFIFLCIFSALAIYVGRIGFLLKTGQITPAELFGQTTVNKEDLIDRETMATTDDPSQGELDAPIVIVEFSDFQCPFCGQAYPVMKQLIENYGDKILYIYRDFPVVATHPQAVLGALAGACAHEQGNFWGMHDLIFENQAELSEAAVKRYAVQLGLNGLQFSSCIDSKKYLSEVQDDLQSGFDAGVRATPTFFINGVKVEGAIPYNTFEKIILSELNE